MSIDFASAFASVAEFVRKRKEALPAKSEFVHDSKSNVSFPGEVCDLKNGRCAQLFGVGTRRVSILGVPVNAYSVGVYSPVSRFQHHLRRAHTGKTAEDLESDQQFLTDVKRAEVEKEIRIVTVFSKITRDKFVKALYTRAAPQLTKEQCKGELAEFESHFDGIKFKKGMDIRLALSGDGTVATFVNGSKMGEVVSRPLSGALADIYLGKEPPSPGMKEDFLTTAATLLK